MPPARRKKPWILLAASLLLFIAGLTAGEAAAVLSKAASICLSCMGIG